MKSNRIILAIACLMIASLVSSYGQTAKEKKAQIKYDNFHYQEAIADYIKLIKKGTINQNILQNIANAYYYNANYEEANKWYEQLIQKYGSSLEPGYLYRYAQSLKSLELYEDSKKMMEKYIALSGNEQRAQKFKENSYYYKNIDGNTNNVSIKITDFNSKYSDFAPSYSPDGISYSSNRDTGREGEILHSWNKTSFLNLYQVNVSEDSIKINKPKKRFSTKAHESSSSYSKDGNTVYFTRNNFSGKFKRDKEGISRLKIYRADYKDGEWKKEVELPFNSKEYSVAHPSLNDAEDKLYFSSDMPGTVGDSDIFYVDIKKDGSYGEPVNLGPYINTEGRETFPFVHDNELYFASDGHPGLGGLDIFGVSLDYNYKIPPKNIGKPINSDEDDFSLIINNIDKSGYFASNRPNGIGSDDIYSFSFIKNILSDCIQRINGIVKDKETNNPIAGAMVKITGNNGMEIGSSISDSNGVFSLEVTCDAPELSALGFKENYKDGEGELVIHDSMVNVTLILEAKEQEILAQNNTDLKDILDIPTIYFDLNKWNIRKDAQIKIDKLITTMKQYPKLEIAIGSHTDSRATKAYNKRLSEKRAQSTRAYLISKGIRPSRISAKGYGETQLINSCSDGVKCTESEHKQNRRSVFKVTKQ